MGAWPAKSGSDPSLKGRRKEQSLRVGCLKQFTKFSVRNRDIRVCPQSRSSLARRRLSFYSRIGRSDLTGAPGIKSELASAVFGICPAQEAGAFLLRTE